MKEYTILWIGTQAILILINYNLVLILNELKKIRKFKN